MVAKVNPIWQVLLMLGVMLQSMGGAKASSSIDWPTNISGLNGWHGLKEAGSDQAK